MAAQPHMSAPKARDFGAAEVRTIRVARDVRRCLTALAVLWLRRVSSTNIRGKIARSLRQSCERTYDLES